MHSVKGGSGTLGLTALFEASRELHNRLRQPEWDPQEVQRWVAVLESAQRALEKALEG